MTADEGSVQLPNGETVRFVVHRSKRRVKTISLRIQDDGSLSIRAPLSASLSDLSGVVSRRADWIARRRGLVAEWKVRRASRDPGMVPYLGELVLVVGGIPALPGPGGTSAGGESAPSGREKRLEGWYRAAAQLDLPPRVARWAAVVGMVPSRIVISRQRAAWGSCARDGTVRLSWRLMMLRPALIEAVIVHELCHLIHHDHSPRFWHEVERVHPGYKALRAELRRVQPTLPL